MISFIRSQDDSSGDRHSRKTTLFPELSPNVFRDIMNKARNQKKFIPPLPKQQPSQSTKELSATEPTADTSMVRRSARKQTKRFEVEKVDKKYVAFNSVNSWVLQHFIHLFQF